ncbi:hypothetical protein L0F63_000177 [Massospora cicadina]|nr:hypothetical protein L0F63_000177 [Massospora cicadina]
MDPHLPYDEIDLYITNLGFFLTPTSEAKRFPKEDCPNIGLFKRNLAEASRTFHNGNPTGAPSEEGTPNSLERATSPQPKMSPHKIKVERGSIHLSPPPLVMPTLSNDQLDTTAGIFVPNGHRTPPTPNPNSSPNRKFLQILFDRSAPLTEIENFAPVEPYRRYRIFGVVGCLRLLTGWHLVVIRRQRPVASVNGCAIFQITAVQLLPYDYTLSVLALEEELGAGSLDPAPPADFKASTTPPTNLFDRLRAAVQEPSDPSHPLSSARGAEKPEGQPLRLDGCGHGPIVEHPPSPSKYLDETYPSALSTGGTSLCSSPGDGSPRVPEGNPSQPPPRKTSRSQDELLEARIKREIHRLFGEEGNMVVSYAFDLTTRLQSQAARTSNGQPLWRTAHPNFWWNRPLQGDLIANELHAWILPIVQGFAQTARCAMDGFPFGVTLISRRDTRRLGMRYQRRGVNDSGHVANFVETEQILELVGRGQEHLCSFVQVRGSIPLFWSQSPYSLKPVPIIERSRDENLDAITRHLTSLQASYGGPIHLVSLTELSGRESIVGLAYRSYTEAALAKLPSALAGVRFTAYDFHKETQGSSSFNLSGLTGRLDEAFLEVGYFWSADVVLAEQRGVFRTNCMDCLDRTNVVQSAFAQRILNLQLFRLGLQEHPDRGLVHHAALEMTIGALWANNGDALSRAYAGTGALKADLTRTGRRNLQGLVNDATNSLARFYLNAFKDFFTQAVLDYLQGHHRLEKFREVAETHVATEPGLEARLLRVRLSAVQASARLVLEGGETLAAGFVMLSPVRLGRLYHAKLEEKVVLLSSHSLYLCSFHFDLAKVLGFTRIPLDRISSLQIGTYLLTPGDLRDAERPPDGRPPASPPSSHGLLVHYRWDVAVDRHNTRSLRSPRPARLMQLLAGGSGLPTGAPPTDPPASSKPVARFVALKGLGNLDGCRQASITPGANPRARLPPGWESPPAVGEAEPDLGIPTLSPDQVVLTLANCLQASYRARVAVTGDPGAVAPLPLVRKTLLSAEGLRKHLYPSGAGLLLSPKTLGNKLLRTFT